MGRIDGILMTWRPRSAGHATYSINQLNQNSESHNEHQRRRGDRIYHCSTAFVDKVKLEVVFPAFHGGGIELGLTSKTKLTNHHHHTSHLRIHAQYTRYNGSISIRIHVLKNKDRHSDTANGNITQYLRSQTPTRYRFV